MQSNRYKTKHDRGNNHDRIKIQIVTAIMTHPIYTREALEAKSLSELKAIAAQLGTKPVVDKRYKQSWILVILRKQSNIQPAEVDTDIPVTQGLNTTPTAIDCNINCDLDTAIATLTPPTTPNGQHINIDITTAEIEPVMNIASTVIGGDVVRSGNTAVLVVNDAPIAAITVDGGVYVTGSYEGKTAIAKALSEWITLRQLGEPIPTPIDTRHSEICCDLLGLNIIDLELEYGDVVIPPGIPSFEVYDTDRGEMLGYITKHPTKPSYHTVKGYYDDIYTAAMGFCTDSEVLAAKQLATEAIERSRELPDYM